MRSTKVVPLESTLKLQLATFAGVATAVLLWSATAFGEVDYEIAQSTTEEAGETGEAEAEFEWEMAEDDDAVTMSFDLEDGGNIDLGVPRGDIVIDTWKGDDVLLVVERLAKSKARTVKKSGSTVASQPVRFRFSRLGNNVTITALDEAGMQTGEAALSFRIVVPTDRGERTKVKDVYDLSRLTSVVFTALHREAIRWIMH
jgi:hypothetical protein